MATTFYDVTTFKGSTSPYHDIGTVINEIIADIKAEQTTQTTRPGAVIYVPPGHYDLLTRVVIDISFLQIKGAGHGFMSQAIRDDTADTSQWDEVLPGGSHIRVMNTDGNHEAFLVSKTGTPALNGRLNSIFFQDFCLNGVNAEKPYSNGKIGISVQSDNDSLRIEGMGFMYLERPLLIKGADAINITNNFIAETGSCIELTGASILGKITNNYLISAWAGYSIFAENGEGLLVSGNTIVWAGKIYLDNVSRSNISSNKILSNFPGMVILAGNSKENLISSNQFRRTWGDGKSDLLDVTYGLIRVESSGNQISSNIFAFDVPREQLLPNKETVPAIIHITEGDNNYLGMNQIVANLPVAVVLDAPTTTTKVLYSATEDQFSPATKSYSFVPTP